jgi:hypothetical protein
MQTITSVSELRNAILLLEIEKAEKARLLKEQFYITYESLKPINILKSTVNELFSGPDLIDNFVGTSLGMVSGYLSKKIVIGTSHNIFRKLFGSLVDFGITNLVSQHPDSVRSLGQFIFQHIFHKKEKIPSREE